MKKILQPHLVFFVIVGIFSGLLAEAKVTDIWSYWRFHMKKGYFDSLLENLQDFYPRNIFDEEKKMLLKAHIYSRLQKDDTSNELFATYADHFPLLADYAQYRILHNMFDSNRAPEEIVSKSAAFVDDFPNSGFLTRVQHMLVQTYFKTSECQAVLATLESFEERANRLTSDQNKRDQWAKGKCLIQLGRVAEGANELKKLWVKTANKELFGLVSETLEKLKVTFTKDEVIKRAEYLRSLAKHKDALALIGELIPRSQCHKACLKLEASLLFSSKKYNEAVKAYQFLYGMLKETRYLYRSCRSYARAARIEEALSCYSEFDRQKRVTPFLRIAAYYFRAALLADEERWDEARVYFEKVITYPRNNLLVQRSNWTLGWIYLHTGKYEQALPYFKTLMNKGPDGIEKGQGAYWLARTYLKLGKKDEAIRYFDQVRRKSPLSYYGILAQNRVNELSHKVNVDFLPSYVPPERLPPFQFEFNAKEMFQTSQTVQERLFLLQIKELAAIGLMEDARYLLKTLLGQKKFPARILSQLYLETHDFFRAIQLAYSQIGYNQTRFPRSNREWFYWNILYPRAYAAWVEPLAEKYAFNPFVLWSIMRSESLFREAIVSNAGARGLLQIMPYTGKMLAKKLSLQKFDPEQLVIPEINILLSSKYVHDLIFKMDGHLIFTIAGYNAGPHKVTRWMNLFKTKELDEFVERVPYVETRKYIMKNIHFLAVYTFLYHPKDARFRVANVVHQTPNPLLNPEAENWNYDIK